MDTGEAFYCGKSIDTFERALNALIRTCGGSSIEDADCISLRCFAFRFSGEVKEWFMPLIPDEDAARRISSYVSGGILEVCKPEDIRLRNHECFMLAGKSPIFTQYDLRELFYSGAKYYALCRKKAGLVLINDMTQNYSDYVEPDELEGWLNSECEYVLRIHGKPELLSPSFMDVIKDAYHLRLCSAPIVMPKPLNRQEEIALSLGLMNYQIQTCKTLRYLAPKIHIPNTIYDAWRSVCGSHEWLQHIKYLETAISELISSII